VQAATSTTLLVGDDVHEMVLPTLAAP
jgi:hypothetical protein